MSSARTFLSDVAEGKWPPPGWSEQTVSVDTKALLIVLACIGEEISDGLADLCTYVDELKRRG